jgi:hypothetical protein
VAGRSRRCLKTVYQERAAMSRGLCLGTMSRDYALMPRLPAAQYPARGVWLRFLCAAAWLW